MISRALLEQIVDSVSLAEFLATPESQKGLGWPIDAEFAFYEEPEIAQGIKGGMRVKVSSLVPTGEDGERLVVLAEFEQHYVRRDLRNLLSSLQSQIRTSGRWRGRTGVGDTLFVVASPGYDDVRFVLFEEQSQRQPRIRSFGWSRTNIGRTILTHNLERLRWSDRSSWERAWDVDGLTEDFYQRFVEVFDTIKTATSHPGGEAAKHSYVQQLLNRLLFLSFIERMGWLRPPNGQADSHDYLKWLWDRHQESVEPAAFYQTLVAAHHAPRSFNGLLGKLFFDGLDDQRHSGITAGDELYPLLGEVPYLNGGLFSEEATLDVPGVSIADDAFGALFNENSGLFRCFNFTVTESTPLDQEVAVDPEMLGKIFERLIIKGERHQSGTYYTPRPIVEFMVNEALKGYLTERGLLPQKAALLVDQDRTKDPGTGLAFDQDDLQDTADWLSQVRAVDPACGSGAYLLMLLQRLFDLTDRVQVVQGKGNRDEHAQQRLYKLKLQLLQNCVYGVDLSETAIRIARLRLWLSLVVENKGEKPEPLPNFDFLVMRGDSLAAPLKPTQGLLGFPHDQVQQYTVLKRSYFHPEPWQPRPSRSVMSEKRFDIASFFEDELASSTLRSLAEAPFDWEVDFAEVFDPVISAKLRRAPGFDLVLANPPYVNSGELLRSAGKAYKDALVKAFPRTATGTADLLIYFMDRAVDLLRPGGQFAFITSNKWLKATYGQKLRGSMAARTCVQYLMDFRDLPVFQGTIAYPLITIATKRLEGDKNDGKTYFIPVTSLKPPYPDLQAIISEWGSELESGSLGKDGTWRLEVGQGGDRLGKMRERGVPLYKYLAGLRIYHGIQTSLNDVRIDPDGRQYAKGEVAPRDSRTEGVFIIDGRKRAELIESDRRSAELIHPLAVGRDIHKWVVDNKDRWMIVTPVGIPIDEYPAIRDHLARFKDKAEARREKGDHYWELRRCAYYAEFEKQKLVYQEIADKPGVALLPPGWYINNKAYMIPQEDLYLMAVLNSGPAEQWFRNSGTAMVGGAVNMHTDMVKHLPVPPATSAQRQEIEALVRLIIEAKAESPDSDVRHLEVEIDQRLEFLYFGEGDSLEEALAKEVADIRGLLRRPAEDTTLEFKETLWYDVRLGTVHGDRLLDLAKAICAMLNREGGTILIGIDDDNRVVGIERDLEKLQTPDKFQRKLHETFGVKLRPDPSDLVRIRFVAIDGKRIARVDVKSDSATMFTLNDKVYIRRDGASVELGPVDAAHWWSRRQKDEA